MIRIFDTLLDMGLYLSDGEHALLLVVAKEAVVAVSCVSLDVVDYHFTLFEILGNFQIVMRRFLIDHI
jgi:hypothetical protein